MQFQDSMNDRTELLQRYIQSYAAPYMIDCNLESNWPVQRAKTYNVIYEILKSVTSQTPVALMSSLMKRGDRGDSFDAGSEDGEECIHHVILIGVGLIGTES